MKSLLNNWQAKLTCLLLGTVLWYVIKQNVTTPMGKPDRRPPSLGKNLNS